MSFCEYKSYISIFIDILFGYFLFTSHLNTWAGAANKIIPRLIGLGQLKGSDTFVFK